MTGSWMSYSGLCITILNSNSEGFISRNYNMTCHKIEVILLTLNTPFYFCVLYGFFVFNLFEDPLVTFSNLHLPFNLLLSFFMYVSYVSSSVIFIIHSYVCYSTILNKFSISYLVFL